MYISVWKRGLELVSGYIRNATTITQTSTASVTRFGEIPPLCQIFGNLFKVY